MSRVDLAAEELGRASRPGMNFSAEYRGNRATPNVPKNGGVARVLPPSVQLRDCSVSYFF
jgi:hypothetical protein